MNKIQNFINNLKQKPFIVSLINNGGEVLAIGGVVRDLILNVPNKDIDLIVRKIPIDTLISQLQKFGKVDVVGKSFGVIKFVDADGTDYDIALPRTEKPNGQGGYQGFDVQSDENLPIEDDLRRRDAKFNAMSINLNSGKFIDPLGGLEDIEKKQISAANSEAFSDDPLRMLRMVSFASRFGFTIEPNTMKMIQENAARVKEIPPERILTEFDKIVKKGNIAIGAQLLMDTGLFVQIFGGAPKKVSGLFANVKTMGEFIYLLSQGRVENSAEFFKNVLKGDINTYKEIKALEFAFNNDITNIIAARSIAHNMYLYSPQSLQSQIIPDTLKVAAQELLEGKFPKTVNELAVNGNDLAQVGLKGKAIGDMQKALLLKIYSGKIVNNRKDLLTFATDSDLLNEEEVKKPVERIEYGCLMLFLNIPIWSKITSIIKPEDIYEKEGFGIEQEPHTTILYGFHDEVTAEDVFKLYKENMPLMPIEIMIGGISVFENPEFDVVKYDVDSDVLRKLNQVMRQLPNTTKFPDYHAHITLAYVKKGEGKKYVKPFEKPRVIVGNELVYTWKGHKGKDGKSLSLNEKGVLKEEVKNRNITYSAVVLDDVSRYRLIERFKSAIPEGFEIVAHHMTINLGAIKPEYHKYVGMNVRLSVNEIAIDDKVIAVGVSGFNSDNAKPHITLAVNRTNGGKPMMSNNLTDWQRIKRPLFLTGKVTEVEYK